MIHRLVSRLVLALVAVLGLAPAVAAQLPNPVMFVTQVPVPGDFATIGSTFANHRGDLDSVARGGDLRIVYPDGTFRVLTQEAGYGVSGFQGATAIAVRDPYVHWDGTKALFSMVIGAPTEQFEVDDYFWQIYEVTNLAEGQTAVITKIPNQPANANNVTPVYLSNGRILFTSDRPRNGAPHLYPQLDEYESTPTNTGLWSLDPATGNLVLLDHAPSGDFTPIVDSFGRVIFTRWDHLQRDQQADADDEVPSYGTFDFADESAGAARTANRVEVFPEPRFDAGNAFGHTFNQFFPWQINQDGSEPETLNHIGRHELHEYFVQSFDDDGNLDEFIDDVSGRTNPNPITNFFQVDEDPQNLGRYVGIEAPEFGTHASGQVVAMSAPPSLSADLITVEYVTHPATAFPSPEGGPVPAGNIGHFRDPLPLSDGQLLAAHTSETREERNVGTRANPVPRYRFRIKRLVAGPGGFRVVGTNLLASAVSKTVSYFDPDVLVTYSGELWELQPVEVRSRPMPPLPTGVLRPLEAMVFAEEGIDVAAFQADLKRRGLALAVMRNVTTRDEADRQQPFNLRVPGGSVETDGAGGKVYDVAYLQLLEGKQVRGMGGVVDPDDGRRVLARFLADPEVLAVDPTPAGAPVGSVVVSPLDGSVAALVPAHRAMTWQLTDGAGGPVVRERYWLTFQAGEIRLCASCHGLNSSDQAGQGVPANKPEALRQLLRRWNDMFADGFESGSTGAWTSAVP